MSNYHHYNPYVSGEGSCTQGQYGFKNKASERQPWRPPYQHHPGSSFSSSGVSSAASSNLGGTIPSISPQPGSQRSGWSGEMYSSSSQRGKEVTSYPGLLTYPLPGLSGSNTSSFSWMVGNKTPFSVESSKSSSTSASTSYPSSQISASSESWRDAPAVSGLSADKDPVPDKTNEQQHRKFTPEIAVNILEKFGLGKEDLEYLLSYPEDQITSDNLPLILRQIRIKKEKRASANQSSSSTASFQKESQQKSGAETKSSSSTVSQSNLIFKNLFTPFCIAKKDGSTGFDQTEAAKFFTLSESDPSFHSRPERELSSGEKKSSRDRSKNEKYDPEEVERRKDKHRHRSSEKKKHKKSKRLKEKDESKQPAPQQKAAGEDWRQQPPPSQTGQPHQPYFYPPCPVPPSYFSHSYAAPPLLPTPAPGLINFPPLPLSGQLVAKAPACGPTQAMIDDYASTQPVMFPHVCTLCNIVCPTMRDWLPHQNTRCHLENCKLLRKRFPQWDGNVDHFLGKKTEPYPSTSAQPWLYGQKSQQRRSRSQSPRRYGPSKRSRETSSSSSGSSSGSESSSRSSSGSRSPSRSPWPTRARSKSRSRSRSRSRSSSSRRHRGSTSQRVKCSSRSRSKHSSRRSRSPFSSRQSHSRSHERRSSSRREDETRFTPRRSWETPSVPGRATPQRRRTSGSAERQPDPSELYCPFELDSTPEPETPEDDKKKSRSSSSSSNLLIKEEESSPPTMVRLSGVRRTMTHSDILAALQIFGKTTSVILYRSSCEANVHFEKEEDAQKLRSLKNLYIEGFAVTVVAEKNTVAEKTRPASTEEQMRPAHQISAASVSSTSSGKIKTPPSSSSADKKTEAETVTCDSDESDSAADSKKKSTTEYSEDPMTSLTVGEMVEIHLRLASLRCFGNKEKCFTKTFNVQLVLISNLPKYTDGLYREEDITNLLHPYGFRHGRDKIYIIPQTGLAIAQMQTVRDVKVLVDDTWHGLTFQSSKLCIRPLNNRILMTWFGFYKSLMDLMHFKVTDNGERTIYIEDISPEDITELRAVLRKEVSIKNFLPLLNKVYVEFESVEDADRIVITYYKNKKSCKHRVYRLSVPQASTAVPVGKSNVRLGNTPPFWVTMKATPFMFPTVSPYWLDPLNIAANSLEDVKKVGISSKASEFCTVMLTGLPDGHYTQTEVARLVWPYISEKNLRSLFTSVVVLPLQKRAFVYFSNWPSCHSFVAMHIAKPVFLNGSPLKVYFVLQELGLTCSEVTVYRNMMKLSNCEVPESTSLETRMLSIEITEMFVDLIVMIMDAVASIASFVNYLPFANRIYIEMSSASDVMLVLDNFNSSDLPDMVWSKIVRVERLNSMQSRLKNSGHMQVHINTASATPQKGQCRTKPHQQTPGSSAAYSKHRAAHHVPKKSSKAPKKSKKKKSERRDSSPIPRRVTRWLTEDARSHRSNPQKTKSPKKSEAAPEQKAAERQTAGTSSEVHPSPPGQEVKVTDKAQSLETASQDETAQEVKTSQDKERKQDEDKEDEIPDSCEDQADKVSPEERSEAAAAPNVSGGDGIHESSDAAGENADPHTKQQSPHRQTSRGEQEEKKTSSDRIQTDQNDRGCPVERAESSDGVTQQDSHTVEDDVSEEDMTHVVIVSEKSAEEPADSKDRQTPNIMEEGGNIKQEGEKRDSEEALNVSEDAGQFSNDTNSKDASKDLNQQESSEALDSVNDQILSAETEQLPEADVRATEEDKDGASQVTNSEDQLFTTETESVNKEESTKEAGLRSRTSESEETPETQDSNVKPNPATTGVTGKDKKPGDGVETICEAADSVQEESGQEMSTRRRSGRRRTRGTKEETPSAANEPTITTRSTRGRRQNLQKDAEKEKLGEDESPARRRMRSTAGREKTTESEDKAPPLRDMSEEDAGGDVHPATRGKARRGRPKKDINSAALKREDSVSEEGTEGQQEQSLPHLAANREEDDGEKDKAESEAETQEEKEESPDRVKAEVMLKVNKEEEVAKHDSSTEEKSTVMTAAAPRGKRGRPRKKARVTPVRRSARGKPVSTEDEREEEFPPPESLDSSSALEKDASTLPSDVELDVQRTDEEAENLSAAQQHQSETLGGSSRADVEETGQRTNECVGPEAKRARSQSPDDPSLRL